MYFVYHTGNANTYDVINEDGVWVDNFNNAAQAYDFAESHNERLKDMEV